MARGRVKGFKIGRSARTGKFMPVSKVRRQKSTAVVETIKNKDFSKNN